MCSIIQFKAYSVMEKVKVYNITPQGTKAFYSQSVIRDCQDVQTEQQLKPLTGEVFNCKP